MAMRHKETAESLQAGLRSNREIGKAIRLLMAYRKISDAEAFDVLRATSQAMNLKLAAAARQSSTIKTAAGARGSPVSAGR